MMTIQISENNKNKESLKLSFVKTTASGKKVKINIKECISQTTILSNKFVIFDEKSNINAKFINYQKNS